MAFFEDLVNELNRAAADSDPVVKFQFQPGMDYTNLLKKMTAAERKIIRGKQPITPEKAGKIIEKINEYEAEIADYDLDEIVGELFFGQYVIPSDGFPKFRMWDVYEKSLELGRPLTDEEFEEFRIDFSKDDDDEGQV